MKQDEKSVDGGSESTESDGYSSDDSRVELYGRTQDRVVDIEIPDDAVRTRSHRLSVKPKRLGIIDKECTRL